VDCGFERVVELALFEDRIEDDGPPFLQLAQIAQALVEGAQLRVVERAGRFLTIAGNEWHGRTVVEQGHCSCDLLLADGKFLGDLSVNGSCHAHTYGDLADTAARPRARIWKAVH
jgi:hypothetical protein